METEKAIIEAAIKELREHEVYDYLTLIEESQIIKAMINFSRAQSTSLLNQIEALTSDVGKWKELHFDLEQINKLGNEMINRKDEQIEALKKENERARELLRRANKNCFYYLHKEIQSFLNEQKPEV